ncbi:hypothetical protein R1flu_027269 [Riccia fluitans]|uniref:Uncharacterized protein n=1 Tax=Riccia fluitans TaxID=41844 RepID=A0ABD1XLC1_9MARC
MLKTVPLSQNQPRSIPEFSWTIPASCNGEDSLDFLEPHEMLELEELHGEMFSPASFPAHVLGYIEHQQGFAEKELDCPPPAVTIDSDLLTKHCISKLGYDNVTARPSGRFCDLLEEINNTCPGTIDAQETPEPEKSMFELEVPLFWDDGLPISLECIHSLTQDRSSGVKAAEILFDQLPGLLNGDYFQNLIVAPELRMDDQLFQSIPVPSVAEWPSGDLQLASVTGVLSKCEPHSMTATDCLYLDWHLEQDNRTCNDAKCFKLHAKLEEHYVPTMSVIHITSTTADSHQLKVALTLAGVVDNVPRRTRFGTAEENPVTLKEFDLDSGRERSTLLSRYTSLPQSLANGDAGKKADYSLNMLEKENLERRVSGIHVAGANFSTHDDGTTTRAEEVQNLRKSGSAAEPVAEEAMSWKSSWLREAKRSNKVRGNSMPDLDHLTYFVQARKGLLSSDPSSQPKAGDEEDSPESKEKVTTASVSERQPSDDKQDNLRPFEHVVDFSVEIQSLMSTLASDYHSLILMRDILGKEKVQELNIPGKFGFDSSGNAHVMALIKSINFEQPITQQRQVLLRGVTALHVLRQTALNLCTYGIQVAHLYLENLFNRIRFLEDLILNSRVELEDAYNKVERGVCQDHPKLNHLEKLLKGRAGSQQKILLIADRKAFFSLYKRLHSSGFTPYQIDRKEQYLQKGVLLEETATKLRNEITSALSVSNCLLVPQRYITDSFPVENFTLIIQYACSGADETFEEVLQRGRCERHIFKVQVKTEEEVYPSIATGKAPVYAEKSRDQLGDKILKLMETTSNSAGPSGIAGRNQWEENGPASAPPRTFEMTPSCYLEMDRTMVNPPLSPNTRCNQVHGKDTESSSFTETATYELILVANVSQQAGNRLTERRSSYQKILALEKQNIQVVERELRIPADILLSPAACVVVYTRATLPEEPQNFQHEQSLLRAHVDLLLRTISLAYRNCILIFEGPSDFTTTVLDIFSDLHAEATWLEVQAQYFISNGEAITDKIIMKTIEATRETKLLNLYPAMTETPTIAEAFLTGFPTLNPLTAHAVLSSGCPLRKFFSMTLEQQYALVQNWNVPRRSCELFKAQCSYREIVSSLNETVGDRLLCRDDPSPLESGSEMKEGVSKFDGQKTAGSHSNCGVISLTSIGKDKQVSHDELAEVETDLDMDFKLSIPELPNMFKPSSSGLGSPTFDFVREDGGSQIRSSMDTVSFESFPEFPPAYEVTGEGSESEEGDALLDLDGRTFGHHSFEDQDFSMPELKLDDPFTSNEEYSNYQLTATRYGGQDGGFLSPVDKWKASISSWDEPRTDGCSTGKHRKIEASCRSTFASDSSPTWSSKEFLGPIHEEKSEDLTPLPSMKITPFSSKPTCKGGPLKQVSLDRFRYQPKNSSAAPRPAWASRKFPMNNSMSSEETVESEAPTPQSTSILRGYVPVDKRSKLLLGLTRRGNDRQQRLVWMNKSNDIPNVFKRQRKL